MALNGPLWATGLPPPGRLPSEGRAVPPLRGWRRLRASRKVACHRPCMSVPSSAPGSGRLPRGPMVAIAVLTLCAAVLGLQPWPQPARTSFGWQVAEVAASLWTLLAVTTMVCFGVALVVSTRGAGLRLSDPFAWAWEVLVLLAGAALVWDGLYMATFSPVPAPSFPSSTGCSPSLPHSWPGCSSSAAIDPPAERPHCAQASSPCPCWPWPGRC